VNVSTLCQKVAPCYTCSNCIKCWPIFIIYGATIQPGIERVLTFRVRRYIVIATESVCIDSIANSPNGAQLEVTPTVRPSYIRVRPEVWECGEGQTDTQTDGRDWPLYTTLRLLLTRNVITVITGITLPA